MSSVRPRTGGGTLDENTKVWYQHLAVRSTSSAFGTEALRKEQASQSASTTKGISQPSVTGGLPPHLLRKKREMPSASAATGPTQNDSHANYSGFGQYYGGTYPQLRQSQKQPQCESQNESQQRSSVHINHGHKVQCSGTVPASLLARFKSSDCPTPSQRQSRPSDAANGQYAKQPTGQQQSRTQNAPMAFEQQSVRDGMDPWSGNPKDAWKSGIDHLDEWSGNSSPPMDSWSGNPHLDAWSGNPHSRGQHQTRSGPGPSRTQGTQSQSQPHPHSVELPIRNDFSGVRLSAKYYADFSPYHNGNGQQNKDGDSSDLPNKNDHELGAGDWSNDNDQQQQASDPELVPVLQKKQWRPKHSCDLSSQSLPGSCKSTLKYDDDDSIRNFSDDNDAPAPTCDIRGAIGGELDLVPKKHGEGFYNKNMWNEYPEDPEDPYCRKWRPTFCQSWVKEMEEFSPWPVGKFLYIAGLPHEECGVDTMNGWLLSPVEYPTTTVNPEDDKMASQAVAARRQQSNANLKIKADYEKLKRRTALREGDVLWEEGSSSSVGPQDNVKFQRAQATKDSQATESASQPTAQSTPRPPAASATRPTAQPTPPPDQMRAGQARRSPTILPGKIVYHPIFGKVIHKPQVVEYDDPPTFLKVPCFLRPAEEGDLTQVLAIYNWEIAHGIQALDASSVDLSCMERVFKQCEVSDTPIIVAVAGRSSDAVARKKAAQDPGPSQMGQDNILGFAFVSIMDTGLGGDVHRNVDRFQGRVHLYVANESRRKGIGRALLQQILVMCSRNSTASMTDFEFYDPTKSLRYDNAFYNKRNYLRIYIKAAGRFQDDPNLKWLTNFLDSEVFCISNMNMHDSRKVGNGQWVDTYVFHHDCQDVRKIKENGTT